MKKKNKRKNKDADAQLMDASYRRHLEDEYQGSDLWFIPLAILLVVVLLVVLGFLFLLFMSAAALLIVPIYLAIKTKVIYWWLLEIITIPCAVWILNELYHTFSDEDSDYSDL